MHRGWGGHRTAVDGDRVLLLERIQWPAEGYFAVQVCPGALEPLQFHLHARARVSGKGRCSTAVLHRLS